MEIVKQISIKNSAGKRKTENGGSRFCPTEARLPVFGGDFESQA